MKAAVHTSYGPPDVVRITEVDTPTPKGNELLVRVYATTVTGRIAASEPPNPSL
jgi:NADPH:quinone reductase-like Zn-dependent oxidoreductase